MTKSLGMVTELEEKGPGILFRVIKEGKIYPAFVIRINENIKAYLNVCAHVGLRLNRDKNTFFSRDGKHLLCSAHGATFDPESGLCVYGPCKNLSLIPLMVSEVDNQLLLTDEEYEYYD